MRIPKTLAALVSLLLLAASPARPQVRVETVPGAALAGGGSSGSSLGSLGGSSTSPSPLAPAALTEAIALPSAAPAPAPSHTPSAPSEAPRPAVAEVPRYQEVLRGLGVPDEVLAKIAPFVTARAGLSAGIVSAMAENASETPQRRALLVTAAALADSEDPQARQAALAAGSAAGFSGAQASALAGPERLAEDIGVFPTADRSWASAWSSRLDLARTAALLEAARRSKRSLANAQEISKKFRTSPDFALLPSALKTAIEPGTSPAGTEAARRYIRSIAGGLRLTESQTESLLEQFFEEKGVPLSSPQAQAIKREILPSKAAADEKATAGIDPRLAPHRAVLVRLASERRITPAAIEAALRSRGMLGAVAGMNDEDFRTQTKMILNREELRLAVSSYPDNEQGVFMKEVAGHMSAPSGKSIEEVSRDGVFGYVDFAGRAVLRASAGRDPDQRSSQVVFYIIRRDGRWRIGGYRQNRRSGTKDAEFKDALRQWLVAGGIPDRDLE